MSADETFWQKNSGAVLVAVILMVAGTLYSLLGGGLENWVDGRIQENPEVKAMAKVREKVTALEAEMRTQNGLLLRLLPPAPGD